MLTMRNYPEIIPVFFIKKGTSATSYSSQQIVEFNATSALGCTTVWIGPAASLRQICTTWPKNVSPITS